MKLSLAILASIISFSTFAHADVLTNARLSQLEKVVQGQQRQISRLESKIRKLEMLDLAIAPTPIRQVDPSQICRIDMDQFGRFFVSKNGQGMAGATSDFNETLRIFQKLTTASLCTLGGAEKCDIAMDQFGRTFVSQNKNRVSENGDTDSALKALSALREVGACQ